MGDLTATSPAAGLLPVTVGGVTVRENLPECACSVMPFARAGAADLEKELGLPFPKPGETVEQGDQRAIWMGQNEALVIGAPVPDGARAYAALVDQTDMWCFVELEGASVCDVLARLVPLDLRQPAFRVGATARSLLGHMNASITRTGEATFLIAVYRSMAGTLVHDLQAALEAVAARG